MVLVGLTLRGPIVGIPPLIPVISEDLSLDPSTAALLTSLPLLMFATLSPVVPMVVRRIGIDRTLLCGMGLLGLALMSRPWSGGLGMLIGTVGVGAAITVGNVVVPALVRRDAGPQVPRVMAASTSAYGVGQAVMAFSAVPVAHAIGWRWSVSWPVLLVVLAIIVLILRARPPTAITRAGETQRALRTTGHTSARVWRRSAAWWLSLFFGMQALLFYTTSTWVPRQLAETGGIGDETAGTALALFHLVGILGTLGVPWLLAALGGRRLGVAVALGWSVYFTGLLVFPESWLIWMLVGGLTQGAGIGLGLTLIATRPASPEVGAHLSGMVQGVGYAAAAAGPVAVGWLLSMGHGWSVPTVLLLICSGIMALSAYHAGAEDRISG
ncbi:MAG: MFS transporter [Nesterenkonia sp.]|nr:MFS transporter [Nesterenkonia sp.]